MRRGVAAMSPPSCTVPPDHLFQFLDDRAETTYVSASSQGHKKDASIKPDIFINTYGIDVQECYDRFHTLASKIKQEKVLVKTNQFQVA